LPCRGVRELLAQLADEHVDDLEFGLVHPAIEMVEEHLLGERRALAERKQLQHGIFLAGQVHAGAIDFDRLGVEIDHEIAGIDDRLGVALGAAHDRVDAGDQFVLVERLGHVVVGAEAEPDRTLSSMPARPERIRIGVLTLATRSERSTS
jgi:hypothetical protein